MTGLVFDVWSVLILVGLIALVGVGMWTLVPRWRGVLPTPSRPRWIRRALSLARVQPGEVVYDLGAGDGRVLVIAAREAGAAGVGYEIEPLHCIVAWFKALFAGLGRRVSIRCRDFLRADLHGADVVFLYLNPQLLAALQPLLASQLRPGARVVSLDFPFEGWEPLQVDIGYLIFGYQMPPQAGNVETYMCKNLTPTTNSDMIPGQI